MRTTCIHGEDDELGGRVELSYLGAEVVRM